MSGLTRWWWVRHAPVVNGDGMIYGSSDIECDVSDTAHFKALARVLPSDAVWFTSHLSRTIKTAQAISLAGAETGLDFPEPIIEEDLGEQNFGDWQGLSWDKMMEADPETYKVYWSDPTRNRPPGGESFADQIARTGAVIDRLGEQHKGRDIVAGLMTRPPKLPKPSAWRGSGWRSTSEARTARPRHGVASDPDIDDRTG